jgi:hypothetical protein
MVFIVFSFFLYSINYEDLLHVASLNEANLLLMGCCKSSLDIEILHLNSTNSARIDSTLTQTETKQLEIFLSEIPDHCRQIIVNLPARQLLNFYQYHTMALQHGLKREWSLAISYEHRVLKGLQTLLPTQKDHYIFFYFYTVLSASFLALGEFEAAIEGLYIALAILLKYTPMDYRTISGYYRHLANAFRILQEWKATAYYLIKAIATARLMTDFDQEYIGILEAELQIAK